jgi:hypothetical protein
MNVHIQTKDETDGTKEGFNEEQGRVLDQFPKKNIKYLLGVFIDKVSRGDIC